jgi:hypothetical protein
MTIVIGAAGLSLFVARAAMAFDAAAPDGSTATNGASTGQMKPNAVAPAAEPDAAERSARSIECSQQADAKDLHGKPRKHFMHACKRGI